MELLEAEPQSSEMEKAQEHTKEETTISQIEEIWGKHYQAMPKLDVRTVQDEKIPPGTMKEIIVHASTGHEGVGLITPIVDRDIRCMHPRAISLMTTRPMQETEEGPITEKERQKNENGCRYTT